MDRYRRCEPRCCERCGEYDCRCGSCCERCGEYDCRCGKYGGALRVKLSVNLNGQSVHYAIKIDQECFNSNALPKPLTDLIGSVKPHTIPAPAISVVQDVVEIVVTLSPGKVPPPNDNYSVVICDYHKSPAERLAVLTLTIY